MTTSPRLVRIEFGDGFDPERRVAFAVAVEVCDLRCDPVAYCCRTRIRYDKAQFAQALPSTPRPHRFHSFCRLGHFAILRVVTRYICNALRARKQERRRASSQPWEFGGVLPSLAGAGRVEMGADPRKFGEAEAGLLDHVEDRAIGAVHQAKVVAPHPFAFRRLAFD